MTNNNKNKKNKNQRGNPVSFNTRGPRSFVRNKVYDGSDIIIPVYTTQPTFSATSRPLNPRISTSFPSAALQAARFDVYEYEMLEFRWIPDQAVTTTPGTVFMAFEPNPNRGVPSTLQAISAYESFTSAPVYSPNCVLQVPKSMLKGQRYTRNGPVSGDLNLYDPGLLIVASQGASTSPQGYIEVRYRIRFDFFHLEEEAPLQHRAAQLRLSGNQTITTATPTDVAFSTVDQSFGGWTIPLTSGVFTLPEGWYQVSFSLALHDTVAEELNANYSLYSDAAALLRGFVTNSSAAGGFNTQLVGSGILYSTGSTNFRVEITMTGAAGTLRVDTLGTIMNIIALS